MTNTADTFAAPTSTPTLRTEGTSARKNRKRPAKKKKTSPMMAVKPTLPSAQAWAEGKVRAKKGNKAMYAFVASQLGRLIEIETLLKTVMGGEIKERVESALNALHEDLTKK